jgi:hypothetical protein
MIKSLKIIPYCSLDSNMLIIEKYQNFFRPLLKEKNLDKNLKPKE